MAGRFVMALFAPETLMEGGILAVLGAMVEGLRTKSSLLGAVFEMSVAAALPVTLLLVEAPTMDLSLSNFNCGKILGNFILVQGSWDVCSRLSIA